MTKDKKKSRKAKPRTAPEPPAEQWGVTAEGCEDGNHDWTVTYGMLVARGTARSLKFNRCARCDTVHLGDLITAVQRTFRHSKFWDDGAQPNGTRPNQKRGKHGKKQKGFRETD